MVTAHRDGTVSTEVNDVEVTVGTLTKDADGDWEGNCALCETGVLYSTKSAAANALEEHFVQSHTTLTL